MKSRQLPKASLSRRAFLRRASAAAASTALFLLGCRPEDDAAVRGTQPAPAAGAPESGLVGSGPRWLRLRSDSGPSGRRDHALAAGVGDRVYLFGGRESGRPLADLWVYELRSETWSRLVPDGGAPSARFGHNMAFDPQRERLLLFGGQAGTDFFNDVWAYEVAANRWRQVDDGRSRPEQRYGAGSAYDGASGLLYVSHGFTSQGRFDDTWALSADGSWVEVSPPSTGRPLKRCLLRCAWDGDGSRLLLFGGQSNSSPYHGDLWVLDVRTRSWREITSSEGPAPRHFYAAFLEPQAGRFIVLGGSTAAGNENDVWSFDTRGEHWSRLTPAGEAPSPRNGHDTAYLPGQRAALLFGGAGASEMNDLWLLRLSEAQPSPG